MKRAGEESCHTLISQPLSPSTIEDGGFLWWPLLVKWPPTKEKPKLIEVVTKVIVNQGPVSIIILILRNIISPSEGLVLHSYMSVNWNMPVE